MKIATGVKAGLAWLEAHPDADPQFDFWGIATNREGEDLVNVIWKAFQSSSRGNVSLQALRDALEQCKMIHAQRQAAALLGMEG